MKTFTLPRIKCISDSVEPVILYSLYKMNGKSWVRVRTTSYDYLNALRVFGWQRSENYSIRPITLELKAAK
jgi:hypothetical protein